jgi:hypothetical protein
MPKPSRVFLFLFSSSICQRTFLSSAESSTPAPLFQQWERHLSHHGRLDELFLLFSDSKQAGEDHLACLSCLHENGPRPRPMPMPTRCQLSFSHETSHSLAGTGDPLSLQFSMHSWAAVYPSIGMISGLNVFGQLTIFSLVVTHRTLLPGVIPTDRDVERFAEQAHRIFLPMIFDELISHTWFCEKMATASGRISPFQENSYTHNSLLRGCCKCQYFLLQKFLAYRTHLPHFTSLKERPHRLLQCPLYELIIARDSIRGFF